MDNNSNIYINVEGLDSSINNLKELIKKTQNIFDDQKSLHERLSKVWNGTTGEQVNKELSEHSKEYDTIINNMNEKVSFLEEVRKSYTKEDEGISNKIDENVKL